MNQIEIDGEFFVNYAFEYRVSRALSSLYDAIHYASLLKTHFLARGIASEQTGGEIVTVPDGSKVIGKGLDALLPIAVESNNMKVIDCSRLSEINIQMEGVNNEDGK